MFKITSKAPERPHWYDSVVFLVNFEHTLNIVLFLFKPISTVDF